MDTRFRGNDKNNVISSRRFFTVKMGFMEIPFSKRPGRHERHFKRKIGNPLFPRPVNEYSDDDLLEIQRLDHEEIVAFLDQLKKLVQQAINLQANEESQVVLDLKAGLEKLYETACRLGDQQENNKAAIRDLLKVIMATVRAHAGGDAKAEMELQQEELARQQHFAMLEHDLVVDLLDTDSLILQDELVAVMLTEDEEQVTAALTMLDQEQRLLLAADAIKTVENNGLADDETLKRRLRLVRGDS
jgi:hypothetical protein